MALPLVVPTPKFEVPKPKAIIKPGRWNKNKVDAFKSSFYGFLKHVKIDSKETGGGTRLADNIYNAQKVMLGAVWDALSDDIHDVKCLKSRQLGISTVTMPLIAFWLGIHDGMQGAVIFDNAAHVASARRKFKTMIAELPPKYKFPRITDDNRDGLFFENRSGLALLAAGVRASKSSGNLGRGDGYSVIWASEVSSWDNPEGVESLKNSMAKENPNRLFIWESTARGFNVWKDMWDEAQADDLCQRAVFIGWWAKESQKYDRGTALFERYGTAPPNLEEQDKIAQVKQVYGVEVTQEQLAWYRRQANPAPVDEDEDVSSFIVNELTQQENPWTEHEAFLQTGNSFFPLDALKSLTTDQCSNKFKSYTYFPGSEFIFCSVREAPNKRMEQLRVWEEPDIDGVYVIAADPAYGHDEKNNNSACEVFRCYSDKIEQVAEYANADIGPQQFAWVIMSLAGWYRNSRVMVEINGPGSAVLQEIKSLKNLLARGYLKKEAEEKGLKDIFNNVKHFYYSRVDSQSQGTAISWKTSSSVKVMILERMRDFIVGGALIIRSRELVEEMRDVVRNGDTIAAPGMRRDDRVYSTAMAVKCWEQHERASLVSRGLSREISIQRRRLSVKDQMSMFTNYQLSSFFATKSKERRAMLMAARKAARERR